MTHGSIFEGSLNSGPNVDLGPAPWAPASCGGGRASWTLGPPRSRTPKPTFSENVQNGFPGPRGFLGALHGTRKIKKIREFESHSFRGLRALPSCASPCKMELATSEPQSPCGVFVIALGARDAGDRSSGSRRHWGPGTRSPIFSPQLQSFITHHM